MNFVKKSILAAAAAAILFALLLVYSLNVLADNQRDLVYQEIQKVLGNDVAFDDFDVTLLTGPGFSAKEFRISDNPIFAATPLVRASELRMGVSLLQLLLGRIVINKLTLVDPEFQIITNEQGLMNVSSLDARRKQLSEAPRPRSAPSRREPTQVRFQITKFRVKNGRIDFIDRSIREPAEMRIRSVEMNIRGITPNGRAKLTLAAALSEGLGQDVRVTGYLGPFVRGSAWKEQPVDLSVEFDSLFVPLLTRAVPFFRNRIPPELDIAGPLSLRTRLSGVLTRPRIDDFVLKAPMMGSSDYNAVLSGSADLSLAGSWSKAPIKGSLRLNSVNVTRLRSTVPFERILPAALRIEGRMSVDSRFAGTWDTLRLGTLVRADQSDLRYLDWLRKPVGMSAQWSVQASRRRDAFVIHESLLIVGKSKIDLSARYEHARARLQFKARSQGSELSELTTLFPALAEHRIKGTVRADIDASTQFVGPDPDWILHGKLDIGDAELRSTKGRRDIDDMHAVLVFLGKQARIESAVFRIGSSHFEMTGAMNDLARPAILCRIRSADLNLADLADFPIALSDRLRHVALSGELEMRNGMPWLRGTLSSPEGQLQDLLYRDLAADMAWSPAGMSFKRISFAALDGTWRSRDVWVSGSGKSQRLALYSQVDSVDLQALLSRKLPLLQDRIAGQLYFSGALNATAHGGTLSPASLKGSGKTMIRRGTLKDFNLVTSLLAQTANAAAKVSIPLSPVLAELADSKDTAFDSLEAHFLLENELIRSDNLLVSTPEYQINAAGWLKIDQTTRWNGILVLSRRISEDLLRENKSLRYLLNGRGQITLPFRADGTISDLRVRPDTRAIAQSIRRGALPKGIEAPPVGKRQEQPEQRESLPAELERFLSR